MTKTTNARSARQGRVTKSKGEVASVAPEANEATIEQPAEVAEHDVAHAVTEGATAEDAKVLPADQQPLPITEEPLDNQQAEVLGDSEIVPAEAPVAEQPVAVVDPFADLPMMKIDDYEFRDLTAAAEGSAPRKYEGVHREAREAKLHIKKGWKHSASMIVKGTTHKEFKPGSVWGTIDQIVQSFGRAGVPAYLVVAKVREAQIGNKRSHYCTALPPIGWAEGWIDTYISKGYGKVMAKTAPSLTPEVKEELEQIEASAEAKVQEAKAA